MCGLAGFIGPRETDAISLAAVAAAMTNAIWYRGPDDSGHWVDEADGIALGHRRLSILDLSAAGHQPMVSADGRYVIIFNGEIYNHRQLRRELDAIKSQALAWRGHSDTETLLAGFETWGVEETLKKTVGMFAIALWDRNDKVLTLARDRLGEKPLYYGMQQGTFIFGSELKALKEHHDFLGEIDRDVICLYLRHSFIPAPYSIYKGIKKLLPGTYVQLQLNTAQEKPVLLPPKAYWRLSEVAEQGLATPFTGSDMDAVTALDTQLKQSIGLQMAADVPLGAFLSGGVDSSAIVSLMQAQSIKPIKTFTIGFHEQQFDEAKFSSAIARHLGTDHTEYCTSAKDASELIPELGRIYDEPFADSSQIPTFLVSRMARRDVTVSLSGDGGDELFCGYNSYLVAQRWERIAKVPFSLRRMAGRITKSIDPRIWKSLFTLGASVSNISNNMPQKLDSFANRLMQVDSTAELLKNLSSTTTEPDAAVLGASEPPTWLTAQASEVSFDDARLDMMFMGTMTYLPDDILVKVDRAAMANSLETRIPLLDHRVVELAYRLPMSMKMRDGTGKWILRQVLDQYVPRALMERPKSGFSLPLGQWLRDELRDWVENLLDAQRLQQEGFFNLQYVRRKWQAHLSGEQQNETFLWNILMFQVWLENEEASSRHS